VEDSREFPGKDEQPSMDIMSFVIKSLVVQRRLIKEMRFLLMRQKEHPQQQLERPQQEVTTAAAKS